MFILQIRGGRRRGKERIRQKFYLRRDVFHIIIPIGRHLLMLIIGKCKIESLRENNLERYKQITEYVQVKTVERRVQKVKEKWKEKLVIWRVAKYRYLEVTRFLANLSIIIQITTRENENGV